MKEFVEQALPTIVQQMPDVMLLVVGEAPKNSLGAGIQTQEEIMQAAQKHGLVKHIKFLGVITDKIELATVYEAADVHVFPVRHIPDDPEGFGMVAIEAAAHGLPTVAFATGGIVDAVAQEKSGYLVPADDYDALAQAAIRVLAISSVGSLQVSSCAFSVQFSWTKVGEKIRAVLAE